VLSSANKYEIIEPPLVNQEQVAFSPNMAFLATLPFSPEEVIAVTARQRATHAQQLYGRKELFHAVRILSLYLAF
jgi:hypothetical protein